MFARTLSIRVKLEMFSEFARIFEQEIVPVLRRQRASGMKLYWRLRDREMSWC